MLWGAGRLLLLAMQLLRASARGRSLPAFRRVSSPRTWRLAVAALAVVLLGGGSPGSFVIDTTAAPGQAVAPGVGPSVFAFGAPVVAGGSGGAESLEAPPAPPTAIPSKRHALLVGIDHAPGARQLQGAVTDALNVQHALRAYGFPKKNVTTLLDGSATRAGILSGIDQLVRLTPADGVAVLVIAAHSRVRGGVNQLLTADGERISSTEIASRLRRLEAKAWIALPTCFAEGYALPGIVGHNRIATFASSGHEPSYELGRAGSYLIMNMVKRAMLEGEAPASVESAFGWAHTYLEKNSPNRVPLMTDGVEGDLVLGRVTWSRPAQTGARRAQRRHRSDDGSSVDVPVDSTGASPAGSESSDPQPEPTRRPPPPGTTVGVCGNYHLNCRHNG